MPEDKRGYIFVLYHNGLVIGAYDAFDLCNDMVNGLRDNGLEDNFFIEKFKKNSICRIGKRPGGALKVQTKSESDNKLAKEPVKKGDSLRRPRDPELFKDLSIKNKQKKRIEQSKHAFETEHNMYNNFKKMKEENPDFNIPELFIDSYGIFSEMDNGEGITWDGYAQRKKYENFDNEKLTVLEIIDNMEREVDDVEKNDK